MLFGDDVDFVPPEERKRIRNWKNGEVLKIGLERKLCTWVSTKVIKTHNIMITQIVIRKERTWQDWLRLHYVTMDVSHFAS